MTKCPEFIGHAVIYNFFILAFIEEITKMC